MDGTLPYAESWSEALPPRASFGQRASGCLGAFGPNGILPQGVQPRPGYAMERAPVQWTVQPDTKRQQKRTAFLDLP